MSVYEIVFSPVGGTKKVSDIFTKSFCTDSNYIDLTERKTDFKEFQFSEDDICIVSVPSYGGRVPGVAVSRLAQINVLLGQFQLIYHLKQIMGNVFHVCVVLPSVHRMPGMLVKCCLQQAT